MLRAALLPLLLLALAAPRIAAAHPQTVPTSVNRYVKVTLLPGGLRLAYTLLVGDRPALALRRRADRDRDGRVSPAEAQRLADEVAAEVAPRVAVTLDGAPLTLSFAERSAGLPDPGVGPSPFSIDLVTTLPVAGGRHVMLLRDRYEPPSEGESEVLFEEAPDVKLEAAFLGTDDARRAPGTRFTWPSPPRSNLEDRTVGARFVLPGGRTWLHTVLAAAGVVAIAAGVWLARRRAARGPGTP